MRVDELSWCAEFAPEGRGGSTRGRRLGRKRGGEGVVCRLRRRLHVGSSRLTWQAGVGSEEESQGAPLASPRLPVASLPRLSPRLTALAIAPASVRFPLSPASPLVSGLLLSFVSRQLELHRPRPALCASSLPRSGRSPRPRPDTVTPPRSAHARLKTTTGHATSMGNTVSSVGDAVVGAAMWATTPSAAASTGRRRRRSDAPLEYDDVLEVLDVLSQRLPTELALHVIEAACVSSPCGPSLPPAPRSRLMLPAPPATASSGPRSPSRGQAT